MRQAADIGTADALKIVGITTNRFRTVMDTRAFADAAPPAVGPRRMWDVDSLVVLAWFDALVASGMPTTYAGRVAGQLRKAMAAEPRARLFNVYCWLAHDQEQLAVSVEAPVEAPPSIEPIMQIPLESWRRNVIAAVDNYYARASAARGGSEVAS